MGVLVAVLLGVGVEVGVDVVGLEVDGVEVGVEDDEVVDLLGVGLLLSVEASLELWLGVGDEVDELSSSDVEELSDGVLVSAGPTATTVSSGTLSVSDLIRVELSATPSTNVVL